MLLALGNAMNESTIGGFTLGSLAKIADTRSTIKASVTAARRGGGGGGGGSGGHVTLLDYFVAMLAGKGEATHGPLLEASARCFELALA